MKRIQHIHNLYKSPIDKSTKYFTYKTKKFFKFFPILLIFGEEQKN